MKPTQALLVGLLLIVISHPVRAQDDPTSRSWNQPRYPFRVAGNIYYVGASDVTSYLITTKSGHILIDGGFAETAPQILQNIPRLDFRVEDVRLILSSHAHYDHAGGIAILKRLTGAKLVMTAEDAALAARGGAGDFAFGDRLMFPAVKADRIIRHLSTVRLGGVTLTAHHTPGHTKGSTTWTMPVAHEGRTLQVVFAGSTSAPGYELANNNAYPEIVRDYRLAFKRLGGLDCDIFLSTHGSLFKLDAKLEMLQKGDGPNPFIDPQGYRDYLRSNEEQFEATLKKQQAKTSPNR